MVPSLNAEAQLIIHLQVAYTGILSVSHLPSEALEQLLWAQWLLFKK